MAGVERELKVEVDESFNVADLIGRTGVSVVSLPEVALTATYYDTKGLDLARWGATLRHRVSSAGGGGWTLKLPEPPPDDRSRPIGLSRDEIDFEGAPDAVPAEAVRPLSLYLRGSPLEPVAELATRRRRHLLLSTTDTLAEMDDDAVEFHLPDGRAGAFRELEIELAEDGPPAILRRFHDAFRKAGVRDEDPRPKLIRAIGDVPAPLLPVVAPRGPGRLSTAELVSRVTAGATHALLVDDPRLRMGEDRAATARAAGQVRGLRARLESFRRTLDASWSERVLPLIGSLAEELSDLADLDAVVDRLATGASRLDAADQDAAIRLSELLAAQRGPRQAEFAKLLDSAEYLRLVDELVGAAWEPPVARGAARDASAAIERAARRRLDHLRDISDARWPDDTHPVRRRGAAAVDADLAAVETAVAQAMYTSELGAPHGGRAAEALHQSLVRLDETATELRRTGTTRRWLRDNAENLDGRVAMAAGLLLAGETERANEARDDWRSGWKAVWKRADKWPGRK